MENKINIYQKMQAIKEELLEMNLKKSGLNKFANFSYYELSDFLPQIIKLCNKYNLFTQINFDKENGTLTIVNAENTDEIISYITPTEELELPKLLQRANKKRCRNNNKLIHKNV